MDTHFYYKHDTGRFSADMHTLYAVAKKHELETVTDEEAQQLGYTKVAVTQAPDDGYEYTIASIEEVDGVSQTTWRRIKEEERTADLAFMADAVRKERSGRLQQCDWTQLPDAPLASEIKQGWAVYRQELRDVTAQSTFPWRVLWPTPPN